MGHKPKEEDSSEEKNSFSKCWEVRTRRTNTMELPYLFIFFFLNRLETKDILTDAPWIIGDFVRAKIFIFLERADLKPKI